MPVQSSSPDAHSFPIEVAPVSIGRWADGNTGIPFLWSLEASRPDPHVALEAMTHGEEICGSGALDLLLREGLWPVRGRLSFPFNNRGAHERSEPATPIFPFYIDHEMNRTWQPALLDWPQSGVALARARELRLFVESVDVLVDLPSTRPPSPPIERPGCPALRWPALIVRDDGAARVRNWGRFGAEVGTRTGLVVDCGQNWAAEAGGRCGACRAGRRDPVIGVRSRSAMVHISDRQEWRRHDPGSSRIRPQDGRRLSSTATQHRQAASAVRPG